MTDLPSRPRLPLVLGLAAISGGAALVYEVVFFRWLGLLFGVSTHAVAVVVAVFLGGLGAGAVLGGRWLARWHALKTYAVLEILIGVYGLAAPLWLPLVLRYVSPPEPSAGLPVWTLLIASGLLAWPTVLMGATFPVLARWVARGAAHAATPIAKLYGWNTVGACVGAWSCGFLWLPSLGLQRTTHIAAAANFSLAACAWWLARGGSCAEEQAQPRSQSGALEHATACASADATTDASVASTWALAAAVALAAGASSVAYQVVGNRLIVSLVGGTVYTFSAIASVFLLGLGLGSVCMGGALARRAQPWTSFAVSLATLAGCMGLGLLLLRWHLGVEDLLVGPLNREAPRGALFAERILVRPFAFAAVTFLPATLISGAILPALARFLRAAPRPIASGLGLLYALNVLGSIVGALVGGFVLMPLLGLRGAFLIAASVSLLPVPFLMLQASRTGELRPWRGPFLAVGAATLALFLGLAPRSVEELDGTKILFHKEAATAAVAVTEVLERGEKLPVRCLFVNGKSVATSVFIDRRLQLLLGFIPALIHEQPKHILSIGLGTGMSSGALAMSGAQVDVVELSEGVIEAAELFDRWTGQVLQRDNVRLFHDDGRAFLRRSHKQYDVIAADPIHPWVAGSALLYTQEYYKLAREHLREDGLMSQWIPLYQLTTKDVAGIVRTFLSVFPESSAWVTGYDMVLVGGVRSRTIDLQEVIRRMSPPEMREMQSAIGVHGPWDLLACRFAGKSDLGRIAELAPDCITDDRPWIEFTAPRSVYAGYTLEILRLLAASNDPIALERADDLALPLIEAANARLREAALRFADEVESTGLYGPPRNRYSDFLRDGFPVRH